MKYWTITRVHKDSIIEEVLRINLETETVDEAREILENIGFEVIEIDADFERIKVA